MSSKISIFIGIDDPALKERVAAQFASDWSVPWNLVDISRSAHGASAASVAIIDNDACAGLFGKSTSIVFAGASESAARYFMAVDLAGGESVEELYKAAKRALAYRETTQQNIESLYPSPGDSVPLELMAQSLTARLHELQKLSEMRLSLIEQLPVGVLGVDDEGVVALANQKAIELLGMEEKPLWGLSVDELFDGEAKEFLSDSSREELRTKACGKDIVVRKSPFLLEKRPVGTILTLLRP